MATIIRDHTGQRKLRVRNPNVIVPASTRVTEPRAGQENQIEKRKVQNVGNSTDCDGVVFKKKFFLCDTKKQTFHSSKKLVFLSNQWELTPDYIDDIITAELQWESRAQLSPIFCGNPLFAVTGSHREVVVEWLIRLQIYLNVGNEVLHLAITLMDLVLDSQRIEIDDLQTLAAASMWISYKFHNGRIKAMCIINFCTSVTYEKLVEFERKVLTVIDLNLMFTNTMTIVHWHLYKVFGREIHTLEYHATNYLLELMYLHATFANETISMRTAVAVEAALRLLKSNKDFLRDSTADGPVYRRLLNALRLIRDSPTFRKNSSLYRKYSSTYYSSISQHSRMDPDKT